MVSLVNNALKVPYEIGVFIASQVPYLDFNVKGKPWAQHRDYFKSGPNPLNHQMKQGLLLEVINHNQRPISIHTRYGQWTVLGGCMGSFDKVFEIVQKTLKLKKIEELSGMDTSYYAIQNWNGQDLEEPIQADKRASEFIPYETAVAAYEEFKPFMIDNFPLSHPCCNRKSENRN